MNRQLLTIRDRYAEVQIAPQWGAALTRYHYGDMTAGVRHPGVISVYVQIVTVWHKGLPLFSVAAMDCGFFPLAPLPRLLS